MARLVAVCRADEFPFERRQLLLTMEDTLSLVIQFPDTCFGCNQQHIKHSELDAFTNKYSQLSDEDLSKAMSVSRTEILNQLTQTVSCVGCRHSVEKLFDELSRSGHRALEPLAVTAAAAMSVMPDYLRDPKSLYALFYMHRCDVELTPKSRKGKRCSLHCLDTHKSKALWTWWDVWNVSSQECREELTLIEYDTLTVTLDDYLHKHRFCTECKNKVQRAYSILIQEVDGATEKGYSAALYSGLRACRSERHIHVTCDDKYLKSLIDRAEPELVGNIRERHAKTLDVAQEEVLTCLGFHLHQRFHRTLQKLKGEDRSWQLLLALSATALRKNIEAAFERKQGVSNIDLICRELLQAEDEASKGTSKRRRKKKNKSTEPPSSQIVNNIDVNKENCKYSQDKTCNKNTTSSARSCVSSSAEISKKMNKICLSDSVASSKDPNHNIVAGVCPCDVKQRPSYQTSIEARCSQSRGGSVCTEEQRAGCRPRQTASHSDLGYSSDECLTCSEHSKCQSACQSASATSMTDVCVCGPLGVECRGTCCPGSSKYSIVAPSPHVQCYSSVVCGSNAPVYVGGQQQSKYNAALSLQDMLQTPCLTDDDDSEFVISDEVIKEFRANEDTLATRREELRQTLRQRFANMQQRCRSPLQPLGGVTGVIPETSTGLDGGQC